MKTPSIKDALTGQKESTDQQDSRNQTENENQEQNQSFTKEQFNEKWNLFLADMDNPNLKAALVSVPEFTPDNRFVIKLENTIQEESIKNIKPGLVSFLRRELKNSSIQITTRIEEKKGEPIVYSDNEKYQAMADQNPDLQILRKKFNLDFGD
jgi:hypothetical protein